MENMTFCKVGFTARPRVRLQCVQGECPPHRGLRWETRGKWEGVEPQPGPTGKLRALAYVYDMAVAFKWSDPGQTQPLSSDQAAGDLEFTDLLVG